MNLPNKDFAQSFEENFMGDPDLFFGVVQIFEAQHRDYLNKLQAAITSENRGEVKAWAHKIKGSISHFHHTNPVRFAHQIEELSQSAAQPELMAHFKSLESHVEALRADLKVIVTKMTSAAA